MSRYQRQTRGAVDQPHNITRAKVELRDAPRVPPAHAVAACFHLSERQGEVLVLAELARRAREGAA